MELTSLSGKWKGYYTLGESYEENEGESVSFILIIEEHDETFNGVCIDNQTKDLFSEPITVSGFRSEELISFSKQYPFSYYEDEYGKIVVDRTKKHPEIAYTGKYDSISQRFSGEFYLVDEQSAIEITEGYLEPGLAGTWTMHKVDE